jgi:hypothetical protein
MALAAYREVCSAVLWGSRPASLSWSPQRYAQMGGGVTRRSLISGLFCFRIGDVKISRRLDSYVLSGT